VVGPLEKEHPAQKLHDEMSSHGVTRVLQKGNISGMRAIAMEEAAQRGGLAFRAGVGGAR
jgi:hypothetical protein